MSRRKRRSSPSGGLVVWKPTGCTSRAAVNLLESRLGYKGLGHTGTLDPLASGLLVFLGGECRKFQDFLMRHRKVYRARLVLGMDSHSDDSEGPLWSRWPRPEMPDLESIDTILQDEFLGDRLQVPPRLSAVRIDGDRSHRRARRGEDATPAARRVEAHRIEVISWEAPVLEIEVECGAGYYVRSLARDLGALLGTGGYLAGLRRTELGPFSEEDAVPLEQITAESWLDPEDLLDRAPRVDVDPRSGNRLAQGQRVQLRRSDLDRDSWLRSGRTVVWCDERIVGLGEVCGGILYPRRWLAEKASS